jgi:hypothetical protein
MIDYTNVLHFIQEHRSNETNFDKLSSKLEEEINNTNNGVSYKNELQEIKEKRAEEYKQLKSSGSSAWPEFENFVAEFERAVLKASKTD